MRLIAALALILSPAAVAPALAHDGHPSDARIAGIVVTANQIDIDTGRLAKETSRTKAVVDFAERMIVDHTAVNKQAAALAQRLALTPEESDTSRALEEAATQTMAKLRKLEGAEFDRAYVAHEVVYHQQVLDAIDKVLLPAVKNAELEALIVKVRPAIAAHLDHAKMIRSSLSGS